MEITQRPIEAKAPKRTWKQWSNVNRAKWTNGLSTKGFTPAQKSAFEFELRDLKVEKFEHAKMNEIYSKSLQLEPRVFDALGLAEALKLNSYMKNHNINSNIKIPEGWTKEQIKQELALNGIPYEVAMPHFKNFKALESKFNKNEVDMKNAIADATGLNREVLQTADRPASELFKVVETLKENPSFIKDNMNEAATTVSNTPALQQQIATALNSYLANHTPTQVQHTSAMQKLVDTPAVQSVINSINRLDGWVYKNRRNIYAFNSFFIPGMIIVLIILLFKSVNEL